MIIRNFLEAAPTVEIAHGGEGEIKNTFLFSREDFETPLNFIIYSQVEPGCSIGYHTHGTNEEVYVILEGSGLMTVNGESRQVKVGDVLLNGIGWSHGLVNNTEQVLKILVFEVEAARRPACK